MQPQGLRDDVVAGITVAFVAVPLSLAIALASSVEPAVGLTTSIVAGVVCALFGGTPLSVSGPAAAMAVLVGNIVEDHGVVLLVLTTLLAGALQLVSGIVGLGKLIRYVPLTVVHGFTAGVGVIILIGQLPRAFGLPPPDEAHVFDVIRHLSEYIGRTNPSALGVCLATVALVFGLPKLSSKLPAPLIAVAITTMAAVWLGLPVEPIGTIPQSLSPIRIPAVTASNLGIVFSSALMLSVIASLETLLSSSVVDKLTATRHDPDQELIGQGLGNMAVAMFGGIPVTGVIVRSSLNVMAGGKTRRASIVHSVIIVITVLVGSQFLSRIPIAALAGILVSVAIRMLNPGHLRELWRVSKVETSVFFITAATMVFVDLLVGVQAGVLVALLIAAVRLSQTHTTVFQSDDATDSTPTRIAISGPVTFLSTGTIDKLHGQLVHLNSGQSVILDMANIGEIDTTGAEKIRELLDDLRQRDVRLVIKGLSQSSRAFRALATNDEALRTQVATTEAEISQLLAHEETSSARGRILMGVRRYQDQIRPQYNELFEKLAEGQTPHTMLITCADSRISPSLMMGTFPGEIFIVRNLGNYVPPFDPSQASMEGAAIEYAVGVLGVSQIIVCGHARCGAIQLMSEGGSPAGLPMLASWKERATDWFSAASVHMQVDAQNQRSREHVIQQLGNLHTYPIVERALADQRLKLWGWFYDIHSGEISEWNEQRQTFASVVQMAPPQPSHVTA